MPLMQLWHTNDAVRTLLCSVSEQQAELLAFKSSISQTVLESDMPAHVSMQVGLQYTLKHPTVEWNM